MSHHTQQGNITSFFKQDGHRASQAVSSSPDPPSSLPSTPAKPASYTQKAVIAASDEDDDDDGSASDDSLEDLSTILGTRRLPEPSLEKRAEATSRSHATETPRAKRTALTLPSSPLTLNPKVHKFDINALAKAARLDDAISASSARAKAAAESMARHDIAAANKSRKETEHGSSEEDDDDRALVGVVTDNAGDDAHKVLRAVRRAEHGGAHTRYCFFDTTYTPPESKAPPKIRGPWRVLTQGSELEREQSITSGLPQTLVDATGELPETLFEWMLDEICVQNSALFRQEYCSLVAQCPGQIEKLVTPERLHGLFLRLGASKELEIKDSALSLTKQNDDPYSERDWACLSDFMALIASVAPSLAMPTVIYAAQALLRLSLDSLILQGPGLLIEYQQAISVLNAIQPRTWDTFCFETATLLQTLIRAPSTRINVLLCLPLHDTLAHELRRRLAISFLFNDPSLAGGPPRKAITMRDLINRLHSSEFNITPKTDFLDLQSKILLLDAAVDDGSFLPADAEEEGHTRLSQEAEKVFNEEVDELADRLREIWRKINDAGLKLARTEAKGVIEWVQQRLAHLVRTRKKLRKSVFDLDLVSGRSGTARSRLENDPFLPKQQDYMKRFLQKPKSTNEGHDTAQD